LNESQTAVNRTGALKQMTNTLLLFFLSFFIWTNWPYTVSNEFHKILKT